MNKFKISYSYNNSYEKAWFIDDKNERCLDRRGKGFRTRKDVIEYLQSSEGQYFYPNGLKG